MTTHAIFFTLCAGLLILSASAAEIPTGFRTLIRTGEGDGPVPLGALLDIEGQRIYNETESVRTTWCSSCC